jgi:hypothetical protein
MAFLAFAASVHAKGSAQAETAADASAMQNNEWILCVTDFDISSMPENKLPVAGVITRKFVERLNSIHYRIRVSREYFYYEGYAWSRARSAAAKALSSKYDERSQLLYRGDADLVYKRNLARIDDEIEKLKTTFEDVDKNAPLINTEPVFNLTASNLILTFPAPPEAGKENKFCSDNKADAMLTGKIIDFHGRFHVSIQLYTVYTQSVVYEDSIIFSADDLETALDEITRKLMMVLSGSRPAAIAVKAQPEEALVLVNRSFAGRGDTGIVEYPPGKYTITASAPDHESLTVETELLGGELANVKLFLRPLDYVNVEVPGTSFGGTVYHGALYVGESPLTLRLPVNTLEYIELATKDKKSGTAVFQTPEDSDTDYSINVRTSVPLKKGAVDRARRWYYWAWGGTWVTGIAAWIAFYTFSSASAAYNTADGFYNQDFYNKVTKLYYVSMGTIIAVGAAVVHEIFHIGRYVYISNKGSNPVKKPGRAGRDK